MGNISKFVQVRTGFPQCDYTTNLNWLLTGVSLTYINDGAAEIAEPHQTARMSRPHVCPDRTYVQADLSLHSPQNTIMVADCCLSVNINHQSITFECPPAKRSLIPEMYTEQKKETSTVFKVPIAPK